MLQIWLPYNVQNACLWLGPSYQIPNDRRHKVEEESNQPAHLFAAVLRSVFPAVENIQDRNVQNSSRSPGCLRMENAPTQPIHLLHIRHQTWVPPAYEPCSTGHFLMFG